MCSVLKAIFISALFLRNKSFDNSKEETLSQILVNSKNAILSFFDMLMLQFISLFSLEQIKSTAIDLILTNER